MQLLYRGHSYFYSATHAKPAWQPRAINWRYQLPGSAQIDMLPANLSTASPTASVQPRAINWRYKIPMEV
jgi:hypothetical protein